MESRNKLSMCRLCLCENECFINIFEVNDWQGYVAAVVISDLLQFQVYETDGYPHVVCSTCLLKLTDFKLFKEGCQKSKVTYDYTFASSENLEEHPSEMVEFVTVKSEPIYYSDDEENVPKDIVGGISDSELREQDPLGEASSHYKGAMYYRTVDKIEKDGEQLDCYGNDYGVESGINVQDSHQSTKSLRKKVAKGSQDKKASTNEGLNAQGTSYNCRDSHLYSISTQCLEYKKPHCTFKGAVDADSCTRNIKSDDESIFEKSKNISLSIEAMAPSSGTKERSEGQWISPGERMYMDPLFQEDMGIVKEEERAGGEEEWIADTGKGVEGERERFECSRCGNVFMTKVGLTQHLKEHGFDHSYKCDVCGKVFLGKCDLIKHVLTHSDSKQYKCTECSKNFNHNSDLNRHMRSHTGSKPYKCAECGKTFSQRAYLKKHTRLHSESKPYKCTECSKSFCQNNSLVTHMRSHTGCKPYTCKECNKSFSQKSDLNRHMRTHTGSKPYKCAECSKSFSQSANLKTHMTLHTGSKPYKCTECSKCFRQNDSLQTHLRSHTGSRPYKCAVCSKSFIDNSRLNKHIRSQTCSKPYKCTECIKTFSENADLIVHMRYHTVSKPFKCETCSKGFPRRTELKKHLLVHTQEKPHECQGCSRRFNRKANLQKHLKKHCKGKLVENEERISGLI